MSDKENYLQKIIDNIIDITGLKDLPKAEEENFRSHMEAQIIRRLGIIVIENLDEKGLVEYEKIIDREEMPTALEFQDFLDTHIPGYEEKLKNAITEFMDEVMAVMMK